MREQNLPRFRGPGLLNPKEEQSVRKHHPGEKGLGQMGEAPTNYQHGCLQSQLQESSSHHRLAAQLGSDAGSAQELGFWRMDSRGLPASPQAAVAGQPSEEGALA